MLHKNFKLITVFFLILVIGFLFIACGNTSTYDESNLNINAKTGESFQVILKENATTGFSWSVDTYDKGLLELVSDESKASKAKNVVGSGGEHVFVFKALKSGSTTIKLAYYKSWEGIQDDSTLVEYNVEISD